MVRLFLYGIAAALIFNKIYFPAIDPITGTLAAFGTYAVGFVARPLGGIVFGHFGDRVGRKSMLMISLMLMGVPTVLIGLTPSYESIGYWGAVALVFCRFLQGLAVGGEWGGAVLMAVEHAPEGKKGLFGSLPQVGVAPGLILSSLAMGAVSRLPEADMLSWGWRLPFLASVFLLLAGTSAPRSANRPSSRPRWPSQAEAPLLRAVLRDHKAPVLAALVACISEKTWFYTIATFSLTYAVGTLGLPRETILNGVIWGAAAALVTIPLFGWLGDRCSKQAIFIAGALGISLFSAGFFALLDEKTAYHTNVAMLVAFGVVYAAMYAQESSLFASMFPPGALHRHLAGRADRRRHWRRHCATGRHLPVGAGRRLAPADRVLSGGAGRGGGGVRADDAAISPAAGAGRRAVRVGQGGQARRAAGQPLNAGLKAGLEARPSAALPSIPPPARWCARCVVAIASRAAAPLRAVSAAMMSSCWRMFSSISRGGIFEAKPSTFETMLPCNSATSSCSRSLWLACVIRLWNRALNFSQSDRPRCARVRSASA